ncbi:uncharacterized protein LOC116840470 isoform X1 [Odontomachus brunneus]|uniref:uncharacterized protein LOC116840470 isoform X1 n=1 Tax=Odontomachus brunneus TaxID=486640 RepID=UPI0013F1E30E|nr:uncharacterized protein LOC116840470 isoform X1 [Odontomachus brunneus]
MSPFFLGYLYFCTAITLIVSLDPSDAHIAFSKKYIETFENCTQCSSKQSNLRCTENPDGPGCIVCYNQVCCFCNDCSFCWHAEWQLISMTYMSISILFLLGITGLFLMYCKLCNRARQPARCRAQQELNGTTRCNTVEDLRERPPLYSEVCGAPPLYTSPYNRVSMQDAPPRYPDTPKAQETCRCVSVPAPPVVQHI